MLKLTSYDRDEDRPLIFPTQAARFLRSGYVEGDAGDDPEAMDAARRVEAAMKEVELRFENLRNLMGYMDDDRPRAA